MEAAIAPRRTARERRPTRAEGYAYGEDLSDDEGGVASPAVRNAKKPRSEAPSKRACSGDDPRQRMIDDR
jgi:hypothetical protein